MRDYEIKRGHLKNIEGEGLPKLMEGLFGPVRKEGDWYVCSFGALKYVKCKLEGKDKIWVDSETDRTVDMGVAQQTMGVWNDFLEAATGMDAKARKKRSEAAAKKGAEDVPEKV
ncbi:MAG TPA: DUF5611 family protein [Candidatus Thermoplasmatota archaeon]|nr:DUF5611 family protein [Candidatus Thermoplasmatota archaeon]